MESPIKIAAELKKQGMRVYVLAGGPEIDWNLLSQVASSPKDVVEARNFNDLFNRFSAVQNALQIGCSTAKGQPFYLHLFASSNIFVFKFVFCSFGTVFFLSEIRYSTFTKLVKSLV